MRSEPELSRFGLMSPPAHPLDRPLWSCLNSCWAPLAQRSGAALRLDPDYGPFAATPDLSPASLADLAAFEPGEDGLWLAEPEPVSAPPGLAVAHHARCVQMMAAKAAPTETRFDAVLLGEEDAPEMLALARLTQPGPVASKTYGFGGFIGIRQEGRLVSMAGERMKPDGFCEISGVCTHPDHRGQGYAGALIGLVAQRILDRGETPFLHAYETNAKAIALYEALGFRTRQVVVVTVLKADLGVGS